MCAAIRPGAIDRVHVLCVCVSVMCVLRVCACAMCVLRVCACDVCVHVLCMLLLLLKN